MSTTTDADQREKVYHLLKKFKTAMLITHSGAANLRARPMAVASVEPSCAVWFFSGRETAKVHEIEADTHVLVVCQDDRDSFISLAGAATLVDDREKAKELWNETYKVWFPGGIEDPDLVLISVKPVDAEYWDNEGFSKIKYMLAAARAYASGTRPEIEEGEQHGRVTL